MVRDVQDEPVNRVGYLPNREPVRTTDDGFLDSCDSRLVRLHTLWQSLRPGGRLPARRDLGPERIVALLPYVVLVNVERPGPSFRYRLVGTREVEFRGWDPTGHDVREGWVGTNAGFCDGNYRHVAGNGCPVFVREFVPTRMGNQARRESLFLPFASDGDTVDIIMVCTMTRVGCGDSVIPETERRERAAAG